VEYFHNNNFIHRDIKPENFAMGVGENSNLLYIIDFGLAKKYRDPQTRMHIPYRDNKRLTGTARYASLFTHLGIEQSRRDDMECLGYTFVYLLKGELPWQGIQAENRQEKYNMIKDKKQNMKIEDICKDLPVQFTRYIYYCRALKFEDKPDYAQLKKMFKDLFYGKQYDNNFSYDWVMLKALGGCERMDSFSVDATNIAECPGRKAAFHKVNNVGSELKVTEISTPKTIYPDKILPTGGTTSQPQATSNEVSKTNERTVRFDLEISNEESKAGFRITEKEMEFSNDILRSRINSLKESSKMPGTPESDNRELPRKPKTFSKGSPQVTKKDNDFAGRRPSTMKQLYRQISEPGLEKDEQKKLPPILAKFAEQAVPVPEEPINFMGVLQDKEQFTAPNIIKKTTFLTPKQEKVINPFVESSSCDFKDPDILEDSPFYGIFRIFY